MTQIGVLALQGDFQEHIKALEVIGAQPVEVRLAHQLDNLDGLIIPGGESTTLRKLADAYGMMDPLRRFGVARPIWGTCAGAILLARHIEGQEAHLGLMDITVRRNAFGRQIDSFVANVVIDDDEVPFPAVFIRAPIIVSVEPGVTVLARLSDNRIVAVQQDHLLATSYIASQLRMERGRDRKSVV